MTYTPDRAGAGMHECCQLFLFQSNIGYIETTHIREVSSIYVESYEYGPTAEIIERSMNVGRNRRKGKPAGT